MNYNRKTREAERKVKAQQKRERKLKRRKDKRREDVSEVLRHAWQGAKP